MLYIDIGGGDCRYVADPRNSVGFHQPIVPMAAGCPAPLQYFSTIQSFSSGWGSVLPSGWMSGSVIHNTKADEEMNDVDTMNDK